ncbi:MAG: YeeE/YedE family protein [Cyclobacteriaceae bacterium]|nr:YeeE/YedE family protein [Cyclobacteriaceae bacterium]
MKNIKFIVFGVIFGIILTKSEVISWFRIQEMFRFQSFHMYGIIGSAIIVGFIAIRILKRYNVKSSDGLDIIFPDKPYNKAAIVGGSIFGLGWALTGACPGPIFAIVGSGYSVFIITLASAVIGTFVYGLIKEKLPH